MRTRGFAASSRGRRPLLAGGREAMPEEAQRPWE